MINQLVVNYLEGIRKQGLERHRNGSLLTAAVQSSSNGDLHADISNALNFSSNDYLGLSEELRLKKAFQNAFKRYPVGSGGSMVISGYHPCHRALEKAFADAYGVDSALLFSSGYAANLGIVSLLTKLNLHMFLDKAAHASFYDGLKIAAAHYSRFKHNDLDHLRMQLGNGQDQSFDQPLTNGKVVITEGIFSMSGQKAPLSAFDQVCLETEAIMIVDEAHSFGVLGPRGLGAVAEAQLSQAAIPLRVIPFGKALGCQGAIVVGNHAWIDALLQASRSYIYSTAISPAFAAGLLEAFRLLQEADEARQTLSMLIRYFKAQIRQSPLPWAASDTPIQQLQLGCPYKALNFSSRLLERNIFCQALRQPTVSRKETGLRIILTAQHTKANVDCLFDNLHLLAKGL